MKKETVTLIGIRLTALKLPIYISYVVIMMSLRIYDEKSQSLN